MTISAFVNPGCSSRAATGLWLQRLRSSPARLRRLLCSRGGTLNHFARDHGIPTDLDEALELACSSFNGRDSYTGADTTAL